MNTNFNLLFYLKKPKTWNMGPVPIYIRITVNSHRAEISAGRDCEPQRWNSRAGRSSGTKEESRMLNHYLDTLQTKIRHAHHLLLGNNLLQRHLMPFKPVRLRCAAHPLYRQTQQPPFWLRFASAGG